jgi:hypothetical protein
MKFKDYQEHKEEISIRLIKLVSGESIICRAPECEGSLLTIFCPMQVTEISTTDLSTNESIYLMTPWIPFAVDQTLQLNKTTIMLLTEVHEDMAQAYLERVDVFVNGGEEETEEPQRVLKERRLCKHQRSTSMDADEETEPPTNQKARSRRKSKST